jgi:hypothetical protein
MPLAFLGVLVVIAGTTGAAVLFGTDMDGSKGFIATAADQQSLVAFAGNAMMIAGLFGAVAVAREYGHGTVVPTFLTSPRRSRTVSAQLTALLVAGAVLGAVGAALSVLAVAVTLPFTDYDFMIAAGGLLRVLAAAAFTGAAGAVLGAGIGNIVRNTGGAVTGAVLLLFIIPPIVIQLAQDSASWVPSALALSLSGITTDPGVSAAAIAVAVWALVPAVLGLVTVQRRDVV